MTTSIDATAAFAASFAALYVAHHIGDYWVQTDHQASHKGDPDRTGRGRAACLAHVITYIITQGVALSLLVVVTGVRYPLHAPLLALLVSGGTHYWIDRRWTLAWLAGQVPGKLSFYWLGMPRAPRELIIQGRGAPLADLQREVLTDNPCLATGAWALDQSLHLLFSVFIPALLLAALS